MASMLTVRVDGYNKLTRILRAENELLDSYMRTGLLEIGEKVAVKIRGLYSPYSARGAAGIKAKLSKAGNLFVAQTLRKSRDLSRRRGNFGGLMMAKAFLPGLDESTPEVEASLAGLFTRMEGVWGE